VDRKVTKEQKVNQSEKMGGICRTRMKNEKTWTE